MEYIYTKNPYEEKPVIVVDKHIGFDETDGQGIMGGQYLEEFFGLSGLGKKTCEVWINTPGGKMMECYEMAGVQKRSPMVVDTLNIGMAASCGGWLQLSASGKVRMMDYATFMCHDAKGDSEGKEAMNLSIAKIVSEGSGRNNKQKLTIDEALKLMSKTTFLSAQECLEMGLCDEIVKSGDNSMFAKMSDKWEAGKQYLNSALLNKNKKMENISLVTNELDLNEDASAKAIAKSVTKLKNELTTAGDNLKTEAGKVTDLTNKLSVSEAALLKAKNEMDAMNDYEDLKKNLNEMTDKFNALDAENKKLKSEKEEAENSAKELKAETDCKNMVNKYTNKIGAEDAVVKEWVDTAKALGIEKTENMLKNLPVFKQGTKITDITNKLEVKTDPTDMASIMAAKNAAMKNKKKQ